jgi:predicted transposase YdaD
MHEYDRSSKWLIQHHGDSILRLGGLQGLRSWRPLQAEVVQPRQLPDGLIEARFEGREEPELFLVEIATYPDRRVAEQALRDSLLVFLDRRTLPEVLTLILRPKGQLRVTSPHELLSGRGWTRLQIDWRVVQLWTLPAADLLAADDVGLIPWVPLTQFDGPPEPVLQQCRQRIDQQAPADERANLLAVAQVLTRLRYNDLGLLAIFGGSQAMIESPLIDEIVNKAKCEARRASILDFLAGRFGPVPPEVAAALQAIEDEARLRGLAGWAGQCPDLDAFRARLSS